MAKVTLDLETFKALASTTRLQVLRALDERRKTGSELARELDLNKATVHEHLQLLAATGLVAKHDEGRKWIYYGLTWQGERILHPQETTTFAVLLGISIAAAGGGMFVLGRALDWWMAERSFDAGGNEDAELLSAAGDEARSEEAQAAPADGDDGDPGEPSGSEPQYDAAPPPASPSPAPGDGMAADEAATSGGGDEEIVFALLMLITSLLLAGLAFVVRRMHRYRR